MNRAIASDIDIVVCFGVANSNHATREYVHIALLNIPSTLRSQIFKDNYRLVRGKCGPHQLSSIKLLSRFPKNNLFNLRVYVLESCFYCIRKLTRVESWLCYLSNTRV